MTYQTSPAGTCYQVSGDGEAVVLIHGVGLDQFMWGGQLVSLTPSYKTITYDMLGHGHSHQPSDSANLKDYADQLKELLNHLQVEKVCVIGFSMGGLVARAFALHYPEHLNAMVIMNSVFNRTEKQRERVKARTKEVAIKGPAANIEPAIDRWFSPEYVAANPAQVNATKRRLKNNSHMGYLKTYELFANSDNYMVEHLSEVKIPTLVLTGELDVGSTPQMAYALAECMPEAKAEVLDGERHMMPVESPKQVNDSLQRFLTTIHNRPDSQE